MAKVFTSLTDPELAELISAGAVGVIPTDTVYGLVAKADSEAALQRFFAVKPRHKEPGTLIGASLRQFEQLGFHRNALLKALSYWPNTISVVLDASDVADTIKQQRTTLPLRMPKFPDLQRLLESTSALMTTSANLHGQPTAETYTEARQYFGDSIDFYVDYGPMGHTASTIIGIGSDQSVIVHRRGAIDID